MGGGGTFPFFVDYVYSKKGTIKPKISLNMKHFT